MTVALVIAFAVTAVLGFVGQRLFFRGRPPDDTRVRAEGLTVGDMLLTLRNLTTLLLAFVLLAVFQSYQDASVEAADEAGAVLAMAEDAVLLTPDARTPMLSSLSCYARSVAGPDWNAQIAESGPSAATDTAADAVAAALQRATADGRNSLVVGPILSSNSLRIQTRIRRFAQAQPSVPTPLWILMLVTMSVTVGGVAAFGHPGARRWTQLVVLIGTVAVFGFTLVLVHDFDRPYDGWIRIEPTAMQDVARRIAALPGGGSPTCAGSTVSAAADLSGP